MTTGSGQELPITRDVLLDVSLAHATDTHRVQVRRIRIKPGQAAGLHVHNCPVVGSIVDGWITQGSRQRGSPVTATSRERCSTRGRSHGL